jgi:hypothetical protein
VSFLLMRAPSEMNPLILITSAKTLFPNKVIFAGRGLQHIWWRGHNSIHNMVFFIHSQSEKSL